MTQKLNCWICDNDQCRKVIGYGIGPKSEHRCGRCSFYSWYWHKIVVKPVTWLAGKCDELRGLK